jgi:hypothetical protein
MVRQAHAYLVSAVSAATLIAVAIAAFVVLVSAQVFKDWPIGVLGDGTETAAVSDASPVSSPSGPAVAAPKTVNPAAAPATTGTAGQGGNQAGGGKLAAAPQQNTSLGSGAPPVTPSEPVASGPASGNGPGSSGSNPSNPSSPSDPGSPPSQSSPASSAGGNATSTSNGSSGSNGGSKPSSGGGAEEVLAPVTGGGSTAAKVTETVNSVDETVTGGALKESGVTGLTEQVVNGVAGPESVVGKTVDETVNAVGGLLGAGH